MAPKSPTIVSNFIEDVWKVMTPAMTDRLKQILTEDFGLSKTDTNNFIQCQRDIRRQRICLKKTTREVRIGPRNQWIKELSKDIADQIAKFVVSILLSERNERTKKLTEHILDRLCEVTGEDTTIESAKTRVERILVVVADRLATWINENVSDIELLMKEKLSLPLETSSGFVCAPKISADSLQRSDLGSELASDFSEDVHRLKDSLVTFDSDVLSTRDEIELSSEDQQSDEKESDDLKSSERSDTNEDSGDESYQYDTTEESNVQETEEESTDVEKYGEEDESEDVEEEGESEESKPGEDSEEGESDEGEIDEEEEEYILEEESIQDESVTLEDEEEIKHESVISGSIHGQSESEITTGAGSPMNILDLLKEDLENLPKAEEKSDRQQVLREVIDNRLKKIVQEKLKRSLDSVIRYDIDETASIVANWVENILSAADGAELVPLLTEPKQGSAFEVMRGDGSQLKVQKISSTAVAKQVAELRGLEPPLRKKKLPRTMSPINIKSMNDWADWALGTADVGNEWDKWIDETLEDVECRLAKDRDSKNGAERHKAWKEWREKKAQEANKWRAEKRRIKAEGAIWNKKLQTTPSEKQEHETRAVTY